jgi:hypothetical protein
MESTRSSRGVSQRHVRRMLSCLAAASLCASVSRAQIPEVKLLASDGQQLDRFGTSVALLPEWAFCGAPFADAAGPASGAVYVYKFDGTNWVAAQKLLAGDSDDLLGYSVAASGPWMVAGAPNVPGTSGAAHIFQLQGGAWVPTQVLAPNGIKFGGCVALSGDRLIVGKTAGLQAGHAYVYELSGSTWVQASVLTAPGSADLHSFASAVDIQGDTAVVGCSEDDNGVSASKQGSVYVYERLTNGVWGLKKKLVAGDPKPGDRFGISVAVDDHTILVGSRHSHLFPSDGAMYVFERQIFIWTLTQELLASDPLDRPMMGEFVALEGDIAIGSAQADGDNDVLSGSAYVFHRTAGTWNQVGKAFAPDAAPNSLFGNAVALCGDKAIIACAGDDWPCLWDPLNCNAGSAYVFGLAPDVEHFCDCPTQGPCGNSDDFGGCATHLRRGGVLSGAGSVSVAADDLFLEARWLSYHSFGVLLMGEQAIQQPFGDGQLCVGSSAGGPWRFDPPQSSGLYGAFQVGPIVGLSSALPAGALISAGQTRYFQAWFRDSMSLCGTDTNLINAVRVTFQP